MTDMSRQEVINNIGYIAAKKSREYVEQRKSYGVNDPYMLNEIEEAYYEGMVQSENFWHPASELPPVDENGNSQDLIVICGTMNLHYDLPRWSSVVGGVWGDKDVEWWCYPPKEK